MRISTSLSVLAGTLMLVGPTIPSVRAEDLCRQTSRDAVKACLADARHDGAIADGKCTNAPSALEHRICDLETHAATKEALNECAAQADFRKASCARTGPEAYNPEIVPSNFSTTINNPYFPLKPGTTFIYEGQVAGGFEHVEFAVTHTTRVIDGVTCLEIHDSVLLNGKLEEDTLDWFAQDTQGNVWYFGEATHEIVDGVITTVHGTFLAGQNGAKPGIIMKAHPAVGDYYRQEFDLGNAEDFAEVVNLHASIVVPYGSFSNVLNTFETTPLETGLHENKFYAPGVGQLATVNADTGLTVPLVAITME